MGFLMPVQPVTLIKGDSLDAGNVDYRDSVPVNMYAVPRSILGASGYMYQFAGLSDFASGRGVDRGGLWCSYRGLEGHYRVSGDKFISIDDNGGVAVLGTVSGTDQCTMTFTFNNIIILADRKLYYYNPTDGFRQITDGGNVGSPISVAFVAQFVVLTDGERIYHSQILNEESFPVENEAVAEFEPDDSLALRKNEDNELVVFGQFSIEHFIFNAATSGFAFSPLDRKASKLGVAGSNAIGELNSEWFIVGRRYETAPSCYSYLGGSSRKIASRNIEQVLKEYSYDQLSATTVDCITIDKVELVLFHFPNETYLFNKSIADMAGVDSAWSLLKTDVNGDADYRARNFVRDPRIGGHWIVGDKLNGNIGLFDENESTQYGDIVEWLMFSPFLKFESLSINSIEVDTISGITGDIQDATVFVSNTEDGRTYGHEYTMLYGNQYDYNQRFIARALGYVRHWVGFKFRGASRNRMAFGLFTVDVS